MKPKALPSDREDEEEDSGLDEKLAVSVKAEEEEEFPLKVKLDSYVSNMEYRISDHKPVIGLFTMEVRHGSHSLASCVYWFPMNGTS